MPLYTPTHRFAALAAHLKRLLVLRPRTKSPQAKQADNNHHSQDQQPLLWTQLACVMNNLTKPVIHHGTYAGIIFRSQISLGHKSPPQTPAALV